MIIWLLPVIPIPYVPLPSFLFRFNRTGPSCYWWLWSKLQWHMCVQRHASHATDAEGISYRAEINYPLITKYSPSFSMR